MLPTNEDMKKLGKQIEQKLEEDKNRNVQVSKALGAAKVSHEKVHQHLVIFQNLDS